MLQHLSDDMVIDQTDSIVGLKWLVLHHAFDQWMPALVDSEAAILSYIWARVYQHVTSFS